MAFVRPDIIRTPITGNKAYGYPRRGSRRRVKPTMLSVIHIAGNRRTAAMPPRRGTRAEIAYQDRPGSDGPTAHQYNSRDGALFRCLDPRKFAAWTNGDLILPDRSQPYVREMVRRARKGINPNELVFRTTECTGHPSGFLLTKAQKESQAFSIGQDSIAIGLPIIPLVTVGIHAHINTRDRRNDPFKSRRIAQVKSICKRANAWKRHLLDRDDPPDEPDPTEPPDAVPPDEQPTAEDMVEVYLGTIEAMTGERDEMRAAFASIGELIDPYDDEEE